MNNSKHEHIKWFFIGAFATLATLVVVIGILIYSLTPLVKVDDSTGRVELFGGLIDVRARDVITQLSKQGSFVFGAMEGIEDVPEGTELIHLKFGAGEVRLDYNGGTEMNWDCDGAGKNTKITESAENKTVSLDFSAAFVDCDITVPIKKVRIEAQSGSIEVREMRADLDIKMAAGQVLLDPLPGVAYEYDFKVAIGSVNDDEFKVVEIPVEKGSKPVPPLKIKVDIRTGSIDHLD